MLTKKTSLIRYSIGIILLTYCIFLISGSSEREIIKQISFKLLIISLLFHFTIQILFGVFQFFSLKRLFNTQISFLDVFIFPFLIIFWGYVIPIKGGMIFSAFYLKEKYEINYHEGISYGLVIEVLSLFFSGIFIAIYAISLDINNPSIFFISILLISSPIIILLLSRISFQFNYKAINFFFETLETISNTLVKSLKDIYIFNIFLLFTVSNIILRGIWIFAVANELKYNFSLQASLAVSSIMSLTQVLQFTPGGLGVSELLSSYIVSFFYIDMVQTLAILVIIRAISLLLSLPVGWFGTIYNLKNLSKASITKIYKSIN